MEAAIEQGKQDAIKGAMEALGNNTITVDGVETQANRCYYFSLNPPHVLFNDNCPESLKESILSIFSYYDVELPLADER